MADYYRAPNVRKFKLYINKLCIELCGLAYYFFESVSVNE